MPHAGHEVGAYQVLEGLRRLTRQHLGRDVDARALDLELVFTRPRDTAGSGKDLPVPIGLPTGRTSTTWPS